MRHGDRNEFLCPGRQCAIGKNVLAERLKGSTSSRVPSVLLNGSYTRFMLITTDPPLVETPATLSIHRLLQAQERNVRNQPGMVLLCLKLPARVSLRNTSRCQNAPKPGWRLDIRLQCRKPIFSDVKAIFKSP
jgi:hypothetical protein